MGISKPPKKLLRSNAQTLEILLTSVMLTGFHMNFTLG